MIINDGQKKILPSNANYPTVLLSLASNELELETRSIRNSPCICKDAAYSLIDGGTPRKRSESKSVLSFEFESFKIISY